MDLWTVMELMGHTEPKTLRRYVHLAPKDGKIRKVFQDLAPAAMG